MFLVKLRQVTEVSGDIVKLRGRPARLIVPS